MENDIYNKYRAYLVRLLVTSLEDMIDIKVLTFEEFKAKLN